MHLFFYKSKVDPHSVLALQIYNVIYGNSISWTMLKMWFMNSLWTTTPMLIPLFFVFIAEGMYNGVEQVLQLHTWRVITITRSYDTRDKSLLVSYELLILREALLHVKEEGFAKNLIDFYRQEMVSVSPDFIPYKLEICACPIWYHASSTFTLHCATVHSFFFMHSNGLSRFKFGITKIIIQHIFHYIRFSIVATVHFEERRQ